MSTPQRVVYPLRLDPDVKGWVEGVAKEESRSINSQINHLLRQAMKQALPQLARAA